MQGGGAKHSLSDWNEDDDDDDDKYDEDDNNDDDDNADENYIQNSRKYSFSSQYLEQNLFAKATWMRLYICFHIQFSVMCHVGTPTPRHALSRSARAGKQRIECEIYSLIHVAFANRFCSR